MAGAGQFGEPEDVTIAPEIDDLEGFAVVRVRSVAVLGHSWGGVVAMETPSATRSRVAPDPDEYRACIAGRRDGAPARAAPTQVCGAGGGEARSRRPQYQAGDIQAEAEYYRIHSAPRCATPLTSHRGDRPTGVRGGSPNRASSPPERSRTDCTKTHGRAGDYDLIPALRLLDIPALIIHGDDDFVPLDVVRRVADAITGSQLVVMPDCGHFAYLEQPERVRSIIVEFLAQSDRS